MSQAGLNNNVIKIHSNKALMAIRLMEQRKEIEMIEDQVKKVIELGLWKLKAEKYWAL